MEILDAVVRLHIETGKPVSSQLVARLLRKAYSPATIRAVMKCLEEDGFLLQPHTSAGRLPTDEGFRAFVDRVLNAWSLRGLEVAPRVRQMIEADLQKSAAAGGLIKVLATLLSELSANIGIVLGPSWESARAVRMDLYPKEGRRILMVLVLENALVRTGQVTLDRDFPRAVVDEASRILSERICGCTVAEIRTGVLPSFLATGTPAGACARDLAERGREMFNDLEEGDLELGGVADLLDEPEFSEPGLLKALIRFIESPRLVRETLHRLSRESVGQLGVWIGAENPIGDLRSFSLLCSTFGVAGRQGILAVLGPRRMPYQRAVSGIDVIRRSMQAQYPDYS